MLTAFSIKTQYLHRCSQRKRRQRKNKEIATSKGGLPQNVGQTNLTKIRDTLGQREFADDGKNYEIWKEIYEREYGIELKYETRDEA